MKHPLFTKLAALAAIGLLLLFGQQTSEQLNGRNGKERLQSLALAEVKNILKAQHAANQVDALLFTSIVIQ